MLMFSLNTDVSCCIEKTFTYEEREAPITFWTYRSIFRTNFYSRCIKMKPFFGQFRGDDLPDLANSAAASWVP